MGVPRSVLSHPGLYGLKGYGKQYCVLTTTTTTEPRAKI